MGVILIEFVHKGMKMQHENAQLNELKKLKSLQKHVFPIFLCVLLIMYLNRHCMLNV
jgi:hypothetical protein